MLSSQQTPSDILQLNADQGRVLHLINNTSLSIFLTGKAGTGKTKFISDLSLRTYKRFVVVAPTGIAAVNAQGATIHSMFQLPVGRLYTPGTDIKKEIRVTRDRAKLLAEIDLLVIDEASMLRADILDLVDEVLKNVRGSSKVFGGIQVLFVGDLFQLPPVCALEEWNILRKFYLSPFFIDAVSFQAANPVTIELQHVYRQKDESFVKLLNQIRSASITAEQLDDLNKSIIPKLHATQHSSVVTLTTHNHLAEQINTANLEALAETIVELRANVDGNFDSNSVLAETVLRVKIGAPVMLIRNYDDGQVLHHNGKIGLLEAIEYDCLNVRFSDKVVSIRRAIWQSFDFSFDESLQGVKTQVSGTFEQFPLRLAWAITIHKSQGLTFDAANIDIAKAFTAGQVYVAISRLRSIDGLKLTSSLAPDHIKIEPRIVEFFVRDPNKYDLVAERIGIATTEYLKLLLLTWFDLSHLAKSFVVVGSNVETTALIDSLGKLAAHGKTFCTELDTIFMEGEVERYASLNKRVSAATNYFELNLTRLSTNIKELTKSYENDSLYRKVVVFLKGLRKSVDNKIKQLELAEAVGKRIQDTQDLGQIL